MKKAADSQKDLVGDVVLVAMMSPCQRLDEVVPVEEAASCLHRHRNRVREDVVVEVAMVRNQVRYIGEIASEPTGNATMAEDHLRLHPSPQYNLLGAPSDRRDPQHSHQDLPHCRRDQVRFHPSLQYTLLDFPPGRQYPQHSRLDCFRLYPFPQYPLLDSPPVPQGPQDYLRDRRHLHQFPLDPLQEFPPDRQNLQDSRQGRQYLHQFLHGYPWLYQYLQGHHNRRRRNHQLKDAVMVTETETAHETAARKIEETEIHLRP